MLTAADVRDADPFALLRALGYPVAPVEVDAAEWRRGGVALPWNGQTTFHLAVRMRDFDVFVLRGRVADEAVGEFLRSYGKYNCATKSVLINHVENRLALYDLGAKTVRRLEVDLAAPTAHAVDRLNLLAAGEEASLRRIFDRALDRESVGRQFFLRFRTAVKDVSQALRACCDGETVEAIDAEALLILSRLLFLSFVQEKGWLNGERRFLVDRLAHEVSRGREWFSGVLLPLFFGCLNTPLHERTLAARRLGRIPYLNGGLFEPSLLEQRHHELHLPNELMQRVIEEVFEKFDFRLDELNGELHGEQSAAGTHVDPEMLGKVFESLMADGERAASGSFYTPREVVDLLTEKAIVHWLGEGEPEALLARLEGITILDPACGSGAFLLSALGVLERLHRQFGATVTGDLRRRIVERSLFGVDLKPEAVRLCELRLWLAIVATTDVSIENVPPLPNLDRNIMQGNSLLAPTDFLGDARADIYHAWVYALRAQQDLLERYRTAPHGQRPVLARIIRGNDQRLASDLLARAVDAAEQELAELNAPRKDLFGRSIPAATAQECGALQNRIAALQQRLERVEDGTLDFFSFNVHFAPVLAAGGFDVVAGNPPWVRNSRIDAQTKEMLTDRYALFRAQKGDAAFHQPDLSVTFFERAVQLTAPGGVVALLLPAKVLNAGYATSLRRSASSHMTIVSLDDWSDDPRRRTWFDADTFPLGFVVRCGKPASTHAVSITAAGESFTQPQASLRDQEEWSLVRPEVAAILERLRRQHRPLAEVLRRRPFMGVKTGDNRSFFLQVRGMRGGCLVLADGLEVPLDAVCLCVRGRDVRRWSTAASHWMLWPPVGGWKPVPPWLERFAAARGVRPSGFRLPFVRAEHVGIKVAWKDLSRGMAAVVLPDESHHGGHTFPLVPNQTLYALDAVSLEEAYTITAVLNSTVADALLVSVAERAKDAHYRYFGRNVARLPFVLGESDSLVRLARRAHRGGSVHEELDALVANLYGVDARELEVLREFVNRRLGAR
jgi:methylase of polypeptide subunit release factors